MRKEEIAEGRDSMKEEQDVVGTGTVSYKRRKYVWRGNQTNPVK